MDLEKIKLIENDDSSASAEEVDKKRPENKKRFFLFRPGVLLILSGLLILAGAALIFFLVSPARRLQSSFSLLNQELGKTAVLFETQDFKGALAQAEVIDQSLGEVADDYQKLTWIRILPYFGRFYQDGEHFLKGGRHLISAAKITTTALLPYYDLLGFEKAGTPSAPMTIEERLALVLDTLDKIMPQVDEISRELSLAKTEIDKVDSGRYPEELFGQKIRSRLIGAGNLIKGLELTVAEIKPIAAYLKPLLGIPEKKTYFLLFQNDAELRPSGGFMTAYAFLSVHQGKFTPLESHDIYWLDNQFGNRLKAPEPILKYLPNVDSWHLRDMNLSPDFAASMAVFWENYQKLPGAQKVDGIIALDTKVLVSILEVLGEIGVSGWGNFSAETDPRCDCPQVFYELERFADQPVSTWRKERKAIIGPLMHSILANIMNSPRKKWPEFLNVFFTSLKEKHLLFYFFDPDLQKAIEALNAGGRIKNFEGDYFHLNDCNFAGAKSNMYIQQTVLQDVEISSDGSVAKKVTVTYKNPAPASNCNLEKGELCLNGFYRNWFRIYVPLGSELLDFKGSEEEVLTYDDLGKTVFEGFFGKTPGTSLKPEGKLTLTFNYRLPFKVNKSQFYRLLVQKQPGALSHDYELKVNSQSENFELSSDQEFEIRW
ncbi:MAG: DUF4012 domain-containing protein [Candidatus Pacebacteria bacterium]|nr:DUF4012 domain-containing protein [Candidatus Paceibacterota bacterium]